MLNYNYFLIDPRPVSKQKNEELFAKAKGGVLGIEVTIPEWAEKCTLGNIDPQHIGGDSSTAAIEDALTCKLPLSGSSLCTIRADIDSIGAMAVILMRANKMQLKFESFNRIRMIAESDKFSNGPWKPCSLPRMDNHFPEKFSGVSSIAACVMDFKVPIDDRIKAMVEWIKNGDIPNEYDAIIIEERDELIFALSDGTIKFREEDGIAIVKSTHRAATTVGYSLAPVVIALNPEFSFRDIPKHKKFTIAQFELGHVNMLAVFNELSELEEGWGGSPTIGGSPQGVSSKLSIKEVKEVVKKHLLK